MLKDFVPGIWIGGEFSPGLITYGRSRITLPLEMLFTCIKIGMGVSFLKNNEAGWVIGT